MYDHHGIIDEELFAELMALESLVANEITKSAQQPSNPSKSPSKSSHRVVVSPGAGRTIGEKIRRDSVRSGASVDECGSTASMSLSSDDDSATGGMGESMNMDIGRALKEFVKTSERQNQEMLANYTIAQLYPEATIMFADIAGFTAWSSLRQANQVFCLLEAIFQAFDSIARRHGVFKVETVGDCYVAVCGLPELNKNHALVMCQFSRDCVDEFYTVVHGLEMKLGPDTGELAIRVGLNSGPVTAGILRGERARMQLFGDTINTTARIETTGMRDRIHLSQMTAVLVKEAGHPDWVTPRNEVVSAKGKGRMSTYWLNHAVKTLRSPAERKREGEMSSYDSRIQRCVNWNTELLVELLKKIVAHRLALRYRGRGRRFSLVATSSNSSGQLQALAAKLGQGTLVVDEVANIIELPKFDSRSVQAKPDNVSLPEKVLDQCRAYIARIASMYRDNPFHNFDHATHVTMSAHKLLSRIMAPSLHDEEMKHDHTYGITSDPLTQFAVVLAALIHDVDHRGVPNEELMKEDKCLSRIYHNKSVAEQNSVDVAWKALLSDEFEDFRSTIFTDEVELKRFRQLLVNSVIATDIFDREQSAMRRNRWARAFAEFKYRDASTDEESVSTDNNRKATIVIEHIIQASDVSHTMQHWAVYQKWSEHLFQEKYEAYINGRADNDPAEGWYEGELWFYDNYVIPLAKKLKNCGVFGVSSDEFINYAVTNRDRWALEGQSIVKKFREKCNRLYGDVDTISTCSRSY